jgi:hypothetical protein
MVYCYDIIHIIQTKMSNHTQSIISNSVDDSKNSKTNSKQELMHDYFSFLDTYIQNKFITHPIVLEDCSKDTIFYNFILNVIEDESFKESEKIDLIREHILTNREKKRKNTFFTIKNNDDVVKIINDLFDSSECQKNFIETYRQKYIDGNDNESAQDVKNILSDDPDSLKHIREKHIDFGLKYVCHAMRQYNDLLEDVVLILNDIDTNVYMTKYEKIIYLILFKYCNKSCHDEDLMTEIEKHKTQNDKNMHNYHNSSERNNTFIKIMEYVQSDVYRNQEKTEENNEKNNELKNELKKMNKKIKLFSRVMNEVSDMMDQKSSYVYIDDIVGRVKNIVEYFSNILNDTSASITSITPQIKIQNINKYLLNNLKTGLHLIKYKSISDILDVVFNDLDEIFEKINFRECLLKIHEISDKDFRHDYDVDIDVKNSLKFMKEFMTENLITEIILDNIPLYEEFIGEIKVILTNQNIDYATKVDLLTRTVNLSGPILLQTDSDSADKLKLIKDLELPM